MASALSFQDKNAICEATDFITLEEKSVNESITEFADKGYLDLWMDAKGLWNFSDKQTVLENMKVYKDMYRRILTCIESAANNGVNAYRQITDLYIIIEELERDANILVNGKSRALCKLAKKFLQNHWKLDHNLKSVECISLVTDIKKTKEIAENLTKTFNQAIESSETLQGVNRNLKDSIDVLREQQQDLMNEADKLVKENERLRNIISEKNERAHQNIKEMEEENRRNMQEINSSIIEIKRNV